jgi:pyruvate formate lyase activating enzyme
MLIGGLQKISLIDFPGKIAAVVFTQGCNMRCPFCHNASLVDPRQFAHVLPESEVFNYLSSRKKQIDGVVISGGEPTLHADLQSFLGNVRELGFSIKLDTNGSKPDVIASLANSNLLDFIAMDIKHDFAKYELACGGHVAIDCIVRSIDFIKNCFIDYEFRTTVVPGIHGKEDVMGIAKKISGAKKFTIQEFVPDHALSDDLRQRVKESLFDPKHKAELEELKSYCLKHVAEFEIRHSN